MNSKFFKILSLVLILIALAMAIFGAYYIVSFKTNYSACQPESGICSALYGLTIVYTIVMIGAIAFSFLSYGHSLSLSRQEERDRML